MEFREKFVEVEVEVKVEMSSESIPLVGVPPPTRRVVNIII